MGNWTKPFQRGPEGQTRELIPRTGVVGGKIMGVWIEPDEEARGEQPIVTPPDEIQAED